VVEVITAKNDILGLYTPTYTSLGNVPGYIVAEPKSNKLNERPATCSKTCTAKFVMPSPVDLLSSDDEFEQE
jgi:hypothetical protein